MRVACVAIPHFPLQVERLRCPGLEGSLVIGGTPFDQAPVVDCSDQAAERGVRPGMPLSEAFHLCPEAAFLPMRECGYDDAWEQVLYESGRLPCASNRRRPAWPISTSRGAAASIRARAVLERPSSPCSTGYAAWQPA